MLSDTIFRRHGGVATMRRPVVAGRLKIAQKARTNCVGSKLHVLQAILIVLVAPSLLGVTWWNVEPQPCLNTPYLSTRTFVSDFRDNYWQGAVSPLRSSSTIVQSRESSLDADKSL